MKNTLRAITTTAATLIISYTLASLLTGGAFTIEDMKSWNEENIVILVGTYVGTALLTIISHVNFEKETKTSPKMPMRTSRR